MSSNHSTYIGPYIEAKTSFIVGGTKSSRTCSNDECQSHGRYDSNSFCNICGSKVDEVRIPSQVTKVQAYEITEAIQENLFCIIEKGTTHLYTSNIRSKPEDRDTDVSHLEDAYPITPRIILNELNDFENKHSRDIEAIEKAYDSVDIKWGAIGYRC
jgi:hypothetical protein